MSGVILGQAMRARLNRLRARLSSAFSCPTRENVEWHEAAYLRGHWLLKRSSATKGRVGYYERESELWMAEVDRGSSTFRFPTFGLSIFGLSGRSSGLRPLAGAMFVRGIRRFLSWLFSMNE